VDLVHVLKNKKRSTALIDRHCGKFSNGMGYQRR